MKLNAKMLWEAVVKETDAVLLGPWEQNRTLSFPCFFDGDFEHLMPGGIYLAESRQLSLQMPERQDILWVVWDRETPSSAPAYPLLLFPQTYSARQILNLLQNIFSRYAAWDDDTEQILKESSSVKAMICRSEPLFNHPLCVMDASGNYLDYSSSFMEESTRICSMEEGDTPATPLIYDPLHDTTTPLSGRDCTLGTLYMLQGNTPFSETEQQFFSLLAEKLARAMQNLSMLSGLSHNAFKQYIEAVFQTRQAEEDSLYAALTQWGGKKGDTFVCYKVKASHIHRKINAEYVCGIFEGVLPASITFWYDAVLVVLVDMTRAACSEEQLQKSMEQLLVKLHMKAGISLPFTQLHHVWYHFRQACCAFEEGYPRHPEETLYQFQHYLPDYILHQAAGEFPRKLLLDRGMQRLMEHDALSSVSYRDTLDAYFQCHMNMSQTAELLQIHRTSLNSRMKKIWECLDHPHTQEYLLYLQIMLALLKEQDCDASL